MLPQAVYLQQKQVLGAPSGNSGLSVVAIGVKRDKTVFSTNLPLAMTSPENIKIALLTTQLTDAQARLNLRTQELDAVRAELAEARGLMSVRLNWEARAVSPRPALTDLRQARPTPGSRIFALGRGGVLVPIIWGKNEGEFFGAWMAYPEVPPSVKDWLEKAWIKS